MKIISSNSISRKTLYNNDCYKSSELKCKIKSNCNIEKCRSYTCI